MSNLILTFLLAYYPIPTPSLLQEILIRIRKGDITTLLDVNYSTIQTLILNVGSLAEAIDYKYPPDVLFLDVDRLDYYGYLPYKDPVNKQKRYLASRAIAAGLLNPDPRVRVLSLYLLAKMGYDPRWVERVLMRAINLETTKEIFYFKNFYGDTLAYRLKTVLPKLLSHSEREIMPLSPTTEDLDPDVITYQKHLVFEWTHLVGAYKYIVYI